MGKPNSAREEYDNDFNDMHINNTTDYSRAIRIADLMADSLRYPEKYLATMLPPEKIEETIRILCVLAVDCKRNGYDNSNPYVNAEDFEDLLDLFLQRLIAIKKYKFPQIRSRIKRLFLRQSMSFNDEQKVLYNGLNRSIQLINTFKKLNKRISSNELDEFTADNIRMIPGFFSQSTSYSSYVDEQSAEHQVCDSEDCLPTVKYDSSTLVSENEELVAMTR